MSPVRRLKPDQQSTAFADGLDRADDLIRERVLIVGDLGLQCLVAEKEVLDCANPKKRPLVLQEDLEKIRFHNHRLSPLSMAAD